jgi:signal transduction histidine kinase
VLRRTRLVLPLAVGVAALLGGLLPQLLPVVVIACVALAVLLDDRVTRVEEERLAEVADRVVAFASDERRPPELVAQGGREWQRLITALNDVARVLRQRFEALRREQRRMERLLEALPTAVLLFGPQGLEYANPTAAELFDLEEPEGLSPLRALGVAGLAQAVAEAAETDGPVTVSVTADGRELVGRATTTGPGQVALIVTDLTSLQRVEAMRRDFVANASHELKTPVTGMRALADSLHLALDRDPERARTMVERIQTEAARLAQLVRDLLDLARLEEGADGRVRQRVDLAEVAVQQVERLQGLADDAGVELRLDVEPAVVVGIAEDMRLIVGNLVENAIQYGHRGGHVDVVVRRRGSTTAVEVADDGIGIPDADQQRIFERFYRVDKARSRAAGGTGLGLSLIRHAVERHGGRVGVSSVLGEGSRFTVELPVDGGMG